MSLVADESVRREVMRSLLAHGVTPDSVFVEDALVVLDFQELLDNDPTQPE